MKRYWIAITSFLAINSAFAQALPSINLQAGIYKIQAEVASTPASRQLGLMHRVYLPVNDGMLFVFENKATHCFWMRNTKIPLAIAPIRYALEMNQGWFSQKGLSAGNVISGIPRP